MKKKVTMEESYINELEEQKLDTLFEIKKVLEVLAILTTLQFAAIVAIVVMSGIL